MAIAGESGYVQSLTTRATNLITFDVNNEQIPNSTVFKSTVCNYSRNPIRRESFTVGVGYNENIESVQDIALRVLEKHPAVLKEPAPWVLVDNLGTATVNLRICIWLDGGDHSWPAMDSSIIRLVKQQFDEKGISMPFEARNVLPKQVLNKPEDRANCLQNAPTGPHDQMKQRQKAKGDCKVRLLR